MKNEKNAVIAICIIFEIIIFIYAVILLINGFFFIPLLLGAVVCLIVGICIYKCCKDRLKEIEEEENVISKY